MHPSTLFGGVCLLVRSLPLLALLAASIPTWAADAVAPDKDLPARVARELDRVEQEIASLRREGPNAWADELVGEVKSLRDRLDGRGDRGDLPAATETTVHVVGFYEGFMPPGQRTGGVARVSVEASSGPIILVLSAYADTVWELELAAGARLQRIILGGYKDQTLVDPPAGVPVEKHTHAGNANDFFLCHTREDVEFVKMSARLKELTGLDITTFQGAYGAGQAAVVVGPSNPLWRAQSVHAHTELLFCQATAMDRAKVRQKLTGAYFGTMPPTTRPSRPTMAQFNVNGPIAETLFGATANISTLAVDPRGPTYYGLARGLVKMEPLAGKSTPIAIPDALATKVPVARGTAPRPMPAAAAFDTYRNRVVMASNLGEGCLICYYPDLAQDAWQALASLNNVDLDCLTYAWVDDCLYGLVKSDLLCFDADGQLLWRRPLPVAASPFADELIRPGGQMCALGEALVLMPGATPDSGVPGRTLFLSPQTGAVLAWTRPRLQSNQFKIMPPDGMAAHCEILASADPNADLFIDNLVACGDEAVKYLSPLLSGPAPTIRPGMPAVAPPEPPIRPSAGAVIQSGGGPTTQRSRPDVPADAASQTRFRLRAVAVLERIGTPAAVECLRELAAGPRNAVGTLEARAALARL
jgi:hypothetical protein